MIMKELIEGARGLGMELSPTQIEQFELYYRELIDWNKRTNLTAITDYAAVQVKHFLDSLTVTMAFRGGEADSEDLSVVDVGSGAGFPGVPLKIVLPRLRLVLIEPTQKKAAFLHHIVGELGLENAKVLNSRAEEAGHLPVYREQFALVLSRAVAPLPTLVELTLPFCRPGGRLVAQKKGYIDQEIAGAERAIAVLGGQLGHVQRIELEQFSDVRYLVVIDKICPTPGRYPRRPGMPKKRPM
jgi:16S rRNA (guanine527-N7)-methyltransferase